MNRMIIGVSRDGVYKFPPWFLEHYGFKDNDKIDFFGEADGSVVIRPHVPSSSD
jgi:hypothetical protein